MKSILEELKVKCPFDEIIEEIDRYDGFVIFKNKLLHIEADYDGHQWLTKEVPYYGKPVTTEQTKEICEVCSSLIADDAFKNLSELRKFCFAHPDAAVSGDSTREYYFYYEGNICVYWISVATLRAVCNLHIHAFAKEGGKI